MSRPLPLVYGRIYQKLEQLGLDPVNLPEYAKSKSPGFMDLNLDRLRTREDGAVIIALSHYGLQNGDMTCARQGMADPDMEIAVYPDREMAEALTYQNDYAGVYQEVYPEPGKVNPRLKEQLNSFLDQWLANALDQGHSFKEEAGAV
jgi:hypothetical protein